jgi:hypothetical protein
MQDFKQIITSLLDEDHNTEHILISSYIPIKEEILRPDLYTKVKSILLAKLRESDKTKSIEEDFLNITTRVKETLDKIENFDKGLAIFIRINPVEISTKINVKIIPLPKSPKKETVISEIYDLDQLIWINNYSPQSLVTVITKKDVQLFSFRNTDLELLKQERNPYVISEPNEYKEQFSPTTSDKIVHGTGGKNTERQKDKVASKFIETVQKLILALLDEESKCKYSIVFYSSNFEEYIQDLENSIKEQTQIKTISKNKQIKSHPELLKNTQEVIDQYRTTKIKEALEYTKSNPGLFANGWYEVAEAARHRKIKTLFIIPDIEKKGYIVKNKKGTQIYTYPVRNSTLIPNISPWIVTNAIENGGEIMTLPQKDLLKKDIAALLRYQ